METFVIGDIHGCAGELRRLLEHAGFDQERHRGLCSGDLYTRGPDPLGVWHLLRQYRLESVRGNHEDYLLATLARLADGSRHDSAATPTQASRAVPVGARTVAEAFVGELREALLRELRRLPLAIVSPSAGDASWVVVHAGVDPEAGLSSLRNADTCTRVRYWPPGGPRAHHWHDFYSEATLLIFGHDAVGGLVERRRPDGRPRLIGLDTGCVYGGRLTGYWIERDCLVSVPAERTWWSIKS
jgi:hypothetical protein